MKSRSQRDGESNEAFLKRMNRTMRTAIRACKGNVDAIASLYGVEPQFAHDVISTNKDNKAYIKEVRTKLYKSGEKVDVVAETETAEEETAKDTRTRFRNWPADPTERSEKIRQVLTISLIENDGDIAESAECLNITVEEALTFVEKFDEVRNARERGLMVQAIKSESELFKSAKSGHHQSVKTVLTNLSDRWTDQKIAVRNYGFEPPEDDKADFGPDIITLVQGAKKDA